MKALLSHVPGGPETLVVEDVAEPQPGAGQVRIAVEAVGINFPDLLIIEDRYQFRPERPFAPGAEVSGVVDAVGEGVAGLKPGDRVLSMLGWGGLAEKVVAPADGVFIIPPSMSFDEAAAFLMTYGTSHHALRERGGLRAGETLLVLGAAGGVGLAAVELGRAMGARVIAAVSSEEKLAVARAAGADAGVVYPSGPFDPAGQKSLSGLFKQACGEAGADVIYDPVGGDYSEPALRSIAWEGRYLVVGFPAGIARLPLNLPLLKGCDIRGVFWGSAVERDRERHRQATSELFALFEQGAVKPRIHERFPLARAADALRMLGSRRAAGKVVVTIR